VYVPILIDAVDPPLGFGESQAASLRGWKGVRSDHRYQAVLSAVRRIAGPGSEKETAHVPQTPVSRRAVVAGGVAAVAAAGVGGWALLRPGAAGASDSIAVLPFANLSGDPAQAYFSDGIAEELRSALARLAGLKVAARTSSEMVRDSDAKTAAQKLGVEHIVSGSVRRSPSTIRVSAQLIDGDDGLERWSQTFDRAAGDLLEIQTSIAENVAQALSIELAETTREVLTLGGTDNPAAQDLYLRANSGRQTDTKEALNDSLGLLNAAIALDPNFAQAHARKGFILNLLAGVYALSSVEAQEGYRQALESTNRALAIEPRLASAYATRGSIYRDNQDFTRSLAELERADSLPGRDAHALQIHSLILAQDRRFEEARRKVDLAKSLDPLNPVSFEIEALIDTYSRNYPSAAAAARRSLQLAPERVQPRRILANILVLQGKSREAKAQYAKLEPTDYRRLTGEAMIAARAGDRAGAMDKLHAMERRYGDAALYQYGQIYAQLGMNDEAISALRAALGTRDPGMAHIQVDPFLDPVRRDPRFAEIVKRMNFPA
jgi:serine/threonine-protein kinase